MSLRAGEWLVLVGSGAIIAFAALVGVLIYLKPPPVRFIYLESSLSTQGEAIFRRENCLSCHELFGNGTTYGPNLDGVGSRRNKSWLQQYLRAPRPTAGAKTYRLRMPTYDTLDPADLDALAAYLQGLRETDSSNQVINPPG